MRIFRKPSTVGNHQLSELARRDGLRPVADEPPQLAADKSGSSSEGEWTKGERVVVNPDDAGHVSRCNDAGLRFEQFTWIDGSERLLCSADAAKPLAELKLYLVPPRAGIPSGRNCYAIVPGYLHKAAK